MSDKKRVYISGLTGSGASYLAEYIAENTDFEIFGTTRIHNDINHRNIQRIRDRVHLTCIDLTDFPALLRYLDKYRPTHIASIASLANVRQSFDNPSHVIHTNVGIAINLLEAVRFLKEKDGYNPIIQQCGTSESYGNPPKELIPIKETCPVNPINCYSISKYCAEQMCRIYHLNFGLNVVITRAFGYLNAKRLDLAPSAFCKQILDIKNGKKENLLVFGNLSSTRTFLDVRDCAKGYFDATFKGKIGETYNVGSNEPISIGEILDKLIERSGIKINKQQDKNLLRPSDVVMQVPDATKLQDHTGWKQRYNLEESLDYFWKEMEYFWG